MLLVILCFNVCYFPNSIVMIFYDDLPSCVLSQKHVKNYLSPNIPSMLCKNIVGVVHQRCINAPRPQIFRHGMQKYRGRCSPHAPLHARQ